METETKPERVYKSRKCVRDAVKKYTNNLKTIDPDKYNKLKEYHNKYSKKYYRELKDAKDRLKKLSDSLIGL